MEYKLNYKGEDLNTLLEERNKVYEISAQTRVYSDEELLNLNLITESYLQFSTEQKAQNKTVFTELKDKTTCTIKFTEIDTENNSETSHLCPNCYISPKYNDSDYILISNPHYTIEGNLNTGEYEVIYMERTECLCWTDEDYNLFIESMNEILTDSNNDPELISLLIVMTVLTYLGLMSFVDIRIRPNIIGRIEDFNGNCSGYTPISVSQEAGNFVFEMYYEIRGIKYITKLHYGIFIEAMRSVAQDGNLDLEKLLQVITVEQL